MLDKDFYRHIGARGGKKWAEGMDFPFNDPAKAAQASALGVAVRRAKQLAQGKPICPDCGAIRWTQRAHDLKCRKCGYLIEETNGA